MIYLDNSATTLPSAAALATFQETATAIYGNPSSVHTLGVDAATALKKARGQVAAALHTDSDRIVFTSGGTLSDNLAIFGAADLHRGRRIITSAIEHPAVLRCFEALRKQGFEPIYVAPRADGVVYAEDIASALTADTSLVSLMHVNNETGAIMPIGALRGIMRTVCPDALLHTDCVQSFCKSEVLPEAWDVDLLSVSAHKIHGLKGAGALYVRRGVRLKPLIYGGGQEHDIAPGTENLPAICAFGTACGAPWEDAHVRQLAAQLRQGIAAIDGAHINSPMDALPNILNVSFAGIPSEVTANALSEADICISKGSACAASKKSKSYVLRAMGAKHPDSAVRLSLSHNNTAAEIDETVAVLQKIIPLLRSVL